jgi:hypothetical protein
MTDVAGQGGAFESKKDAGKGQAGVVSRWLIELDLADKSEEDWRKCAQNVADLVRDEKGAKGRKKARYNIVASNVMTLEPALYAQPPRPDIRPRYDQKDPVAAAVAKVLEKATAFHLDAYDFDAPMKGAVHDVLVPGRAVTRVRYKPIMKTVKPDPVAVLQGETGFTRQDNGEAVEKYETAEDGSFYVQDPDYEKKLYEETCFEHVHWDDFRRGPGRSWNEVTWIAFRHRFTREQCVEKFGATVGNAIALDYEPKGIEGKKKDDDADAFKRAFVWEIWTKEGRKVIWIAPSYKSGPAKTEDDPLELMDFFPIPRPLYAKNDPSSLVPVEDYRIYQDQAQELDVITRRISIITAGLKFRGMYDSAIKGMKDLMGGEDNDFVPVENATQLTQNGGLEKALFFLPIERAATVLKQLYTQRAEVKQEIFELSGVADIMRGATNANETLGAQKIKAQWGTQRLQDRQRGVQRYARDLIRLLVEIIAEKYDPMTLKLMTGMEVTPDMLQLMRLDGPRSFRIDIETDSTIAVDTEAEQSNLAELTQGLGTLMQAFAPMVQSGAMPMEAAKKIVSSVIRKFKLGREVEDALDMAAAQPAPQQGQDPAAQAAAAKAQAEQQALQVETQARIAKANADMAATQQKQQSDQAKHYAAMQQIHREAELAAAQHAATLEELDLKRSTARAKAAQAQQGVSQNAA